MSRLYIAAGRYAHKEKELYFTTSSNTAQDCGLSSEVIRDKNKATHHMETTASCITNESVKAIFMRKCSEWTQRTVEEFNQAIVTVQEGWSWSLPPPSAS